MMHLKIRRCYANGGPGRTRTFDVSNVADLQSAALTAGLPTHIFAFLPAKMYSTVTIIAGKNATYGVQFCNLGHIPKVQKLLPRW